MTERYESRASTHADDCWSWGPGHYKCAVREIERMRTENERLREDAERYRWALNNSCWIRGEHAAYVAIPVAREADLSCVAMRDAAIDAAMAKEARND